MEKRILLSELLKVSRLEPVVDPENEVEPTLDAAPQLGDEPTPEFDSEPHQTDAYGLRPDGSSDGLDALDLALDLFGNDPDASPYEASAEVNAADVGTGLDPAALGDETDPLADPALGGEEGLGDEELPGEDENFQGTIRTVRGACLVFKRKDESGTFEELWIYNVGKGYGADNSMQIRKSILAGTDIEEGDTQSEDGSQEVHATALGNVQYLHIRGLPN